MFKTKMLSATLAATLAFGTFGVSFTATAASKAEQELVGYLTSLGVQDSFTWERIEGDSLSDATIYGVSYINDAGTADEKKYLIKEMVFDDYTLSDDGASVEVKYQGVTDEDGVHIFLSDKLQPESHFKNLDYKQLDDIEVKLKYVMGKANGALEGKLEIEQDEVFDSRIDFKTEGLDMLIDQLSSLNVATLDPNLILVSAMATKIHRINLDIDDDGYNKRLLEHRPNHRTEVAEQYQTCLESVAQFGLKDLEQGCSAIRDYLLDKEDKLHISMNPAKPFSIGEYMPMFMLVGSAGADAMGKLVQRILNEINLKISN